jgi:hypothetical protein
MGIIERAAAYLVNLQKLINLVYIHQHSILLDLSPEFDLQIVQLLVACL